MTRRTFGDLDQPPLTLPAPHPRENLDPVAAALESHYTADELNLLDGMLRHFVTLDEATPANRLQTQIAAAYQAACVPDPPRPPLPEGVPVAFSVYASDDPAAEPLPVLLGPPGDQQRVTVIPAGRADWELADGVPGSVLYPGRPAQQDAPGPESAAPVRPPGPM